MGTVWSLRLDNPGLMALDHVHSALEGAFAEVISQMSTWEPESEICRFNRAPAGELQPISPAFLSVLECALHWARASDGAIDPTAGALVALWGFGANASSRGMPSVAQIEQARATVGWQRLEVDADSAAIRQLGGVALDLSGIAKGFAVDCASASLIAIGLQDFILEVGGELRAVGKRPDGRPWRVQVEAAEGRAWTLPLNDMSIATSGDRWFNHSADGRSWSHTIDPRSGQPVDHALASVSVMHAECMQADALATLLTVLGPEDGLAFADAHELAALFVVRGTDGALTPVASSRWPALVEA